MGRALPIGQLLKKGWVGHCPLGIFLKNQKIRWAGHCPLGNISVIGWAGLCPFGTLIKNGWAVLYLPTFNPHILSGMYQNRRG
jgi:hypothetical protein